MPISMVAGRTQENQRLAPQPLLRWILSLLLALLIVTDYSAMGGIPQDATAHQRPVSGHTVNGGQDGHAG